MTTVLWRWQQANPTWLTNILPSSFVTPDLHTYWFPRLYRYRIRNKQRCFLGPLGSSDVLTTQRCSAWVALTRTNHRYRKGPVTSAGNSFVGYTYEWQVKQPMTRSKTQALGFRTQVHLVIKHMQLLKNTAAITVSLCMSLCMFS